MRIINCLTQIATFTLASPEAQVAGYGREIFELGNVINLPFVISAPSWIVRMLNR